MEPVIRVDDLQLVRDALAGDRDALARLDALLGGEVDAAAATVRAPGGLGDEVKQRLRKAWKLRNRTVHTESSLNPVDVKFLIETIRELLPECS